MLRRCKESTVSRVTPSPDPGSDLARNQFLPKQLLVKLPVRCIAASTHLVSRRAFVGWGPPQKHFAFGPAAPKAGPAW